MTIVIRFSKKGLRDIIRIGMSTLLFTVVSVLPNEISYASYRSSKEMPALIADWQLIVATIIQEARLESLKGMTMVAEVIRDRTRTKFNSDGTIAGTILRAKQFSGWNDSEDKVRIASVKIDLADNATQKALYAYKDAFENNTYYAMGANLYHADYMNPYPEWTKSPNVVRLTQEGHHIFYREDR